MQPPCFLMTLSFNHRELLKRIFLIQCALLFAGVAGAAEFKFDFGSGSAKPGYTQVTPQTPYDPSKGYGYLEGGTAATPGGPASFAVGLEEGNYDVTMLFGNAENATSTTVKAEARRLMIEKVETAPGEFETRTFTVNVRRPKISTGGSVGFKPGEKDLPEWDDLLTFEFNGTHPGVASMEIASAKDAITVFLAGDSTVTDQANEPWAGWGQMLPRFFQQGVAVANHARSGLALFSFEGQRRLAKVLSVMKSGDYLFIQFAHNDQKDKSPGSGPFTSYKDNLKRFVKAARSRGGIPVLVTPMERRRWSGDKPQETLTDFAAAVRQVGDEEKVPVIDLHAMSLQFYEALGSADSTKAFVHYPAHTFPGQDKPLKDDTHHNGYGAYELARCVVEGIREKVPDLAKHLRPGIEPFDPSRPDAPAEVDIPASPFWAGEKPAGN